MGLELGVYISDLVATNPTAADAKSQGDDHIRLLKSTVKATFPNVTGAVTATQAELNKLTGATITTAELNALHGVTASAAELNIMDGVTVTTADINSVTGKAPIASPTFTGVPTAPTAAPGTNTNQLATMAALIQQAFSATLPAQSGHNGQFLITDGINAAWAAAPNQIVRAAKTGAYTVLLADRMSLIDCTSGTWTLGFTAAATLGSGWACYVRNSGTGDITLDPNASETIDGLTSFVMYPGAVRLIQCDGAALRSIPIVGGTKVFTSTASYVWPPGISQFDTDVIAAGGGGGGGARSTVRYNGGGAGAGERYKQRISSSQIIVGGSTTCTIGAKGVGGAAATGDNLPGSVGTAGGSSSVGALIAASGGTATSTNAKTSEHGYGASGGGKGQNNYTLANQNSGFLASGQVFLAAVAPGGNSPSPTEYAGPSGRAGDDVTGARQSALLGGQTSGRGGAYITAGTAGANGANPGDAGDGGAGNVNGSAAGKGGDGVNGKITIVEVI